MAATKDHVVTRCVERIDGGYWIITHRKAHGSSPFKLPIGARVEIVGGVCRKPGGGEWHAEDAH